MTIEIKILARSPEARATEASVMENDRKLVPRFSRNEKEELDFDQALVKNILRQDFR